VDPCSRRTHIERAASNHTIVAKIGLIGETVINVPRARATTLIKMTIGLVGTLQAKGQVRCGCFAVLINSGGTRKTAPCKAEAYCGFGGARKRRKIATALNLSTVASELRE